MILTSHRLDCFRLTMDSLFASDSLGLFDHVALMLNGVEGRHLAYVRQLMADHPELPWDTIAGPRGKKERVANLQNECVRRYPHSLYFKIDEDMVLSAGWATKLAAAYEHLKNDPDLALITPAIPNNAVGFYYLLKAFPELEEEYGRRFSYPLTTACDGPIWNQPALAQWILRKFIDLRAANEKLEARFPAADNRTYVPFAYRFNINCLVYDYRHWEEMGGIPNDEEPAWGQWVPDHGKHNMLVMNTMVHHYTFSVQQDWMDRSSLLEDLRLANAPSTLRSKHSLFYHAPRLARLARQLPRVIPRKVQAFLGRD